MKLKNLIKQEVLNDKIRRYSKEFSIIFILKLINKQKTREISQKITYPSYWLSAKREGAIRVSNRKFSFERESIS